MSWRRDGALANPQPMEPEAAAKVAFARLKRLVAAGYQPDWESSNEENLWLRHPSKKAKHADLSLGTDGSVYSIFGKREERFLWENDETLEFTGLIRSTPRSTWWDRSRDTRWTIFIYAAAFGLIWLVSTCTKAIF